jgi:uncharacterized protein
VEDQTKYEIDKERRLKMLLVDSIDDQWFAFEPASSNLILITDSTAVVLLHIQQGGKLKTDIHSTMTDLLQIGVIDEPKEDYEKDPWGVKLHLNHACNLACEYCYADGRLSDSKGRNKGAYGGPVSYMGKEVIEQAIKKTMESAPGGSVLVSFFGGEPLLSEKRFLDAVKIVNNFKRFYKINVTYEIVTNGTLVTEAILDCFKENKFRVMVSIDGDSETHNRQRPFANGADSHKIVVENISRISLADIPVGARMTVIRGRPGFVHNHYRLAKLPVISVSTGYNIYGNDAQQKLCKREKKELFSHYSMVTNEILEGNPLAKKLDSIQEIVLAITEKRKKNYHCAAGRWDFTVVPEGTVFPCHRFVGMNNYALGNIMDTKFEFTPQQMFVNNSLVKRIARGGEKEKCGQCFAQFLCAGGCAQLGISNTGSINEMPKFYCDEFRLRVAAVVKVFAIKLIGSKKLFNAQNLSK